MKRALAILCAGLGAVLAGGASAQDYPTKPISMIVPFAAGGPTDTLGRLLAQSMSKMLGQTVVIDNTVGAGGTIAGQKAARAAPDGYTLFLHHIGHATSATLYRNLAYKPLEDFTMIGEVADVPMTIIGRKDYKPKDLKELVAYLKEQKDKATLGNAGIGAASHLCGMLFMKAIGVELTTVPYKGTAPAMNDLLGGQIDLLCDQTTNTTSQIKAEKVKAYAVTTKTRVASVPDLPTADEAGLPGFQVAVWHGLYAPKGTPKPVVDRVAAALREAIKDETVKARLAELGAETVSAERATPENLQNILKAEIERWAPIIKAAGVYAD
jgi:tripartite-type tricarboxylate transporter receptor subunit TctC